MKLQGARLASFLAAPDAAIRAVLVYGPDLGLVRERADRIAAAIVPDRNDPFRISDLASDRLVADPARLDDEARALSLMPGRRLIRVRDAGDALAPLVERLFSHLPPGDSLVLIEAGDLPARSALRRACEGARLGAAIACYLDGAEALAELARSVLAAHRVRLSPDAMDYLVANLGGDRLMSRQELEKLALYAGDGNAVGYDEVSAVIGDSAEITLDDAVHAAAGGDAAALERSLRRSFEEGESPVTVLRAAMRHFQRLYLAGGRVAAGASPDEAMNGLRPPVFFKLRDRFKSELGLWPPRRAASALETLLEAERNAKRTGLPPEAVCRDALLRLARAAEPRKRRTGPAPSAEATRH
ncbi:MAG TPA: DNA polymerase III subunit delta [Stellaceae bacterium]|nr:DNA polymerase III subunit delta [Stellaceae bacterium]